MRRTGLALGGRVWVLLTHKWISVVCLTAQTHKSRDVCDHSHGSSSMLRIETMWHAAKVCRRVRASILQLPHLIHQHFFPELICTSLHHIPLPVLDWFQSPHHRLHFNFTYPRPQPYSYCHPNPDPIPAGSHQNQKIHRPTRNGCQTARLNMPSRDISVPRDSTHCRI